MNKLNYSFSVVYTSNNFIKKYKYNLVNRYELLSLKKDLEDGKINIYCNCESKVPLALSQTKIPFLYPKTRGVKHSIDCCRHPSYKKDIYFENAWVYNEQKDKYEVNVETNLLSNNKYRFNNSEYLDINNFHQSSFLCFIQKLNLIVWESIIKGYKKKIPKDNNEFMKHLYGFSNKIYLNEKESSLFELFYNNKQVTNIEIQSETYFIYMEFIEIVNNYDNGKSLVLLKNSNDKYTRFYINTEYLLKELKTVKYGEKIILSGLVNRENLFHKTYLTINEFCLLPIIKEGLFILNKEEGIELKKLINKNTLFYKPSEKIMEYGDYVPSFIILKENEIPTICEVFLKKESKEYVKIKEDKLKIFKEKKFIDKYKSWYIDLK